jgi:hypothetical protein
MFKLKLKAKDVFREFYLLKKLYGNIKIEDLK